MPPLQFTEPATASGLPSLPSPPTQRQPAQPPEMNGPSAEFWKQLDIRDDALTGMDTEPYNAWLRGMFRGIAWLAYNRLQSADPHFRERKHDYFNRWRTQCDPQVSQTRHDQYKDKVASFLRTRKNFQYLAGVLGENFKDWYLVSGERTSTREIKPKTDQNLEA